MKEIRTSDFEWNEEGQISPSGDQGLSAWTSLQHMETFGERRSKLKVGAKLLVLEADDGPNRSLYQFPGHRATSISRHDEKGPTSFQRCYRQHALENLEGPGD